MGAAATPCTSDAADSESLKRKLLEALSVEDPGICTQASVAFCEGAAVEIHGLKGMPELNGRRGKLQQLDAATARWHVDIEGVGPKKLKPDNLKLVQADS